MSSDSVNLAVGVKSGLVPTSCLTQVWANVCWWDGAHTCCNAAYMRNWGTVEWYNVRSGRWLDSSTWYYIVLQAAAHYAVIYCLLWRTIAPIVSDVSPWPWSLRPKYKSLSLALRLSSLALVSVLGPKSLALGSMSLALSPKSLFACITAHSTD